MSTSSLGNDEQIHHSEGKIPKGSCPSSSSRFIKESEDTHPVYQSLTKTKSPPGSKSLRSKEKRCIVKRIINRLMRCNKENNYQINYVQYSIDKLTLEVNEDLIHNNTLGNMIQNINALYCTITNNNKTNYYGCNEQRKDYREAETAAYEEVKPENKQQDTPVNMPTGTFKDYSKSVLICYIVNRCLAIKILEWLHLSMDSIESPKAKLIYLRALYEAGYFTKLVPRKVYIEEFGYISKSNYNAGMGKKLSYKRDDINSIIEQLPF